MQEPIILAIPFFLATMLVEAIALRNGAKGTPYELADTRASISMGLGYLVVEAFWRVVDVAILAAAFRWSGNDLGDGWLGWTVAIVGWDFFYYGYHRAGHEVRLLWAAHVNHHSSERYNLSTALRQPWTPFLGVVFFVPLALLGVSPELIVVSGTVNLLYQYWIHTETIDRLPRWFEWLLNTPSHHRVHHGANPEYIDRNYAGIFMLWDRMFGSFEPEIAKPVYGLTKNVGSFHPVRIAFHEYAAIAADVRAAASWRERAGYIFGHPGSRPAESSDRGSVPAGVARI